MLPENIVRVILKEIANGVFFTVIFIKKNGDERTMKCQLGVSAHTKGGESTIKEKENLIGVYERDNKEYRCFDVARVVELHACGVKIVAAK